MCVWGAGFGGKTYTGIIASMDVLMPVERNSCTAILEQLYFTVLMLF